jgi:transcriptional regulator with XRE-family HTH domain
MRNYAARNGIVALSELGEVSRRIKELRNSADLKQYEVAAKLNVPPRTYQSWENGEVETDRENYAKIGGLLGASANWILFGQEDEPLVEAEPVNPGAPSESDAVADLRARIDELLEVSESRHSVLLSKLSAVQTELEQLRKQQQLPGRGQAKGGTG